MRAERRDELEENDLAESTLELVDRIRPHMRTVVIGIGLLFAALAIWTLVSAQFAAGRARSWETCMAAMTAGDANRLAEVARQYPDTPAAGWSQLLLADSLLQQGCDLLFTDRSTGMIRLENAVTGYRQVLASRPTGMLAERGVFGLAKANEALGDLEAARRGYEAVVAEHPQGSTAALAKARVAALGRPATRQWYDWFAGQNPQPAAAAGSAPVPPPATPDAPGQSTPAVGQ